MTTRGGGWRCGASAAGLAMTIAVMAPSCGKAADGEPCTEDDDCSSGACPGWMAYGEPSGLDTYCAGQSSCETDGDCEQGWRCLTWTSFTDDFVNFFGADSDSSACRATCGHCPPDQHCVAGQTSDLCEAGSLLVVTVEAPTEALVGEPVELSAAADGSARIVSFSWSIITRDGAQTLPDASVTHTFEQAGMSTATVTVVDGTGHEATAQATIDVRVGQGGACSYSDCALDLECVNGACQ